MFRQLIQMLYDHWWLILMVSLLLMVGLTLALPWALVRLPADYFSQPRRHPARQTGWPGVLHRLLSFAKNVVGGLLVCAGLLMLVTPGPGFMSIVAGLTLMNFPGKFRFERWLAARPGVRPAINWLRHQAHTPPFEP